MNVCCGSAGMVEEIPKFTDVKVKVEEGTLSFDNKLGDFKYVDTKKMKAKKEEIKKLEEKLKNLDEEKEEYQKKINDLEMKIKNMKKLVEIDFKENKYIKTIGEKTQENNMD